MLMMSDTDGHASAHSQGYYTNHCLSLAHRVCSYPLYYSPLFDLLFRLFPTVVYDVVCTALFLPHLATTVF